MKRLISIFLTSLLSFAGVVGISQPAKADSLDVIGATVTWDASMLYEPTGCSSFNFSYQNGSGIRLLQLEFQIKSKFGDSIARVTDRNQRRYIRSVEGANLSLSAGRWPRSLPDTACNRGLQWLVSRRNRHFVVSR